jgi:16S rRNA (cytidine1402-2'-O)-methyltransferase
MTDLGGGEGTDAGEPWAALARLAGLHEQEFAPGLYVVATPLGNAADVSVRALWVLRGADCIAAEDTRTSAPWLARFGIRGRLVALHEHNEVQASRKLLERLERGERVALISDAGTPAICDPGALLVRMALERAIRVMPVPGPSSLAAALSVSGVREGAIRFLGFAPSRGKARRECWRELSHSPEASVFFEAPHRIASMAQELSGALDPHRRVVVARELTKRFESVAQCAASELVERLSRDTPRGEYVVVVDALPQEESPPGEGIDEVTRRWLEELAGQLPASRIAAIAAKVTGVPRAEVYRFLLRGLDQSTD